MRAAIALAFAVSGCWTNATTREAAVASSNGAAATPTIEVRMAREHEIERAGSAGSAGSGSAHLCDATGGLTAEQRAAVIAFAQDNLASQVGATPKTAMLGAKPGPAPDGLYLDIEVEPPSHPGELVVAHVEIEHGAVQDSNGHLYCLHVQEGGRTVVVEERYSIEP